MQRKLTRLITCVADLQDAKKLSKLQDDLTCSDPTSAHFKLKGFKHETKNDT